WISNRYSRTRREVLYRRRVGNGATAAKNAHKGHEAGAAYAAAYAGARRAAALLITCGFPGISRSLHCLKAPRLFSLSETSPRITAANMPQTSRDPLNIPG